MDFMEIDGVKFPFPYMLSLLKFIFQDYTSLKLLRNGNSHETNYWMSFLEIISVDMLRLVELNLSEELILEYQSYVSYNHWNNDFMIRKSCKNLDSAVKFLKLHFGHLEYKQFKKHTSRHLRVIK